MFLVMFLELLGFKMLEWVIIGYVVKWKSNFIVYYYVVYDFFMGVDGIVYCCLIEWF